MYWGFDLVTKTNESMFPKVIGLQKKAFLFRAENNNNNDNNNNNNIQCF